MKDMLIWAFIITFVSYVLFGILSAYLGKRWGGVIMGMVHIAVAVLPDHNGYGVTDGIFLGAGLVTLMAYVFGKAIREGWE